MLFVGIFVWFLGLFSVGGVNFISPLSHSYKLKSLSNSQVKVVDSEVFGFAPHWTLHKLENVDFDVLTTLAYFDAKLLADGSINKDDDSYRKFHSDEATALFDKAHNSGTRVVLTVTQMNPNDVESFLNNTEAQDHAVSEIVQEVADRGIDGVNIDIEYFGGAGADFQPKFTGFVRRMTEEMHKKVPGSKVTVSLYASAVMSPRIYDVAEIANASDGIFMMAYDFAVTDSDQAMPTAPLYGAKDGEYWYDISTAVDDFLGKMPAEKLILGLPWYGYEYPVYNPGVKAETQKGYYKTVSVKTKKGFKKIKRYFAAPPSRARTSALTADVSVESSGWDEKGQVGWVAYKEGNSWRMIFQEDAKSLGIKYDFAKEKKLGGIGMWALGFEDDSGSLWRVIEEKFGNKRQADAGIGRQVVR